MARAWLTLFFLSILSANPAVTPADGVPSGFRPAPAFVPLFTPRGAPPGAYRAFVSPQPLETALASLRDDPSLVRQDASFEPQSLVSLDAFGQSGGYNRWKLARLYGAKRARVARGPRAEDGHVTEVWTLISPYPDESLERLEPGTLLIVLRIP